MKFKVQSLAILGSIATTLTAAPARAQDAGVIQIDGSSTVFPITEAVAEEFQNAVQDGDIALDDPVQVVVAISGTGGGFRRFCSGETDISNASRPMKESEQEECAANGVSFIEIPVAYDALTIVVNPENPIDSITFEELQAMWSPDAEGTIKRWNQVNSSWPDAPLELYGPGADSGTFDYFTDTINGDSGVSRGDFTASEDDNVLVQGVATSPNALGYFGFAYYGENTDRLKGLAVDGGDGPVEPSPATVNDGSYPLSRPIYIYVSTAAAARPEVEAYVDYYLDEGRPLVTEVGYVRLPDEDYAAAFERFTSGVTGRVPLRAGL